MATLDCAGREQPLPCPVNQTKYSGFSPALREELSRMLNRVVLDIRPGWEALSNALGLNEYAESLDLLHQSDPTARLMEIWEVIGHGSKKPMTALRLMRTLKGLTPIPRYDVISVIERHLGIRFDNDAAEQRNYTIARKLDEAACRGDIAEIERMLAAKKFKVHEVEELGWTPLHSAAHYGHPECCKYLVEVCGFSIARKSRNGYTACEWAKLREQDSCVEVLSALERGCSPTSRGLKEASATKERLPSDPEETKGGGKGEVHETDSNGKESKAGTQAKALSVPLMEGSGSETPTIDDLARSGKAEELRERLVNKGNPDERGGPNKAWTPLHSAVDAGSMECVKVLLEFKADIDKRNDMYYTPEEWAVCLNRREIANVLFEERMRRLDAQDGANVPINNPALLRDYHHNIAPDTYLKVTNKELPIIPDFEVEVFRPGKRLSYIIRAQPSLGDMLKQISEITGVQIVSFRDIHTKGRLETVRGVVNVERVLACTIEDERTFPQELSHMQVSPPSRSFEPITGNGDNELTVIPFWKNYHPSIKVVIPQSPKNFTEVVQFIRAKLDCPQVAWLLETKTYRCIGDLSILRSQRKIFAACHEDYDRIVEHLEGGGPLVRHDIDLVQNVVENPTALNMLWLGHTVGREFKHEGGTVFQRENGVFLEVPNGAASENKPFHVHVSVCQKVDDLQLQHDSMWLDPLVTHIGPTQEFFATCNKFIIVNVPHNLVKESKGKVNLFKASTFKGCTRYCLEKTAGAQHYTTDHSISRKLTTSAVVAAGCIETDLEDIRFRYAVMAYIPQDCFVQPPIMDRWTAKVFIVPDLPLFYTQILQQMNADDNHVLHVVPQILTLSRKQHVEMNVFSTEAPWTAQPDSEVVSSDRLFAHLDPSSPHQLEPHCININVSCTEAPPTPFYCQLSFSVVNNIEEVREDTDFLGVEIRHEAVNPDPLSGLLTKTSLVREFKGEAITAVSLLLDGADSSDRDWTALADLLGFTAVQKRRFTKYTKSPSMKLLEEFSQRIGTKAVLERALHLLHRYDALTELGYTL